MTRIWIATATLAAACLPQLQSMADDRATNSGQGVEVAVLTSTFRQHCLKCHGLEGKVEGEVDLRQLQADDKLMAHPALVREMIEVIDSGYMPPEDQEPLAVETRQQVVSQLHRLLQAALSARTARVQTPIRRMNRFQYNNAVQDLFHLNVEVFSLPERMLREHGGYFQPQNGAMPKTVKVGSRPLGKSQLIESRLAGVSAFPQDLRAEHGFDNRADHLSLSPLLLESFLKLGRSIVESPDFGAKTCGIWGTFFAPPSTAVNDSDLETVVRDRLQPFLTRAFRRPSDDQQVRRYTNYVLSQMDAGATFTDSMKSAAAAVIASPRFFYLYDEEVQERSEASVDDFNLASRLSFFLWGSIPDRELLDLAAAGQLHKPDILREQVKRMLRDKRLKRFCDSFPAQWLQLERIISSTPDPQQYPQFYFAKYRVSMHMMLEPLLLFETVLIENQSILQFIDSDFAYRSNLLQSWYRDGSQGNAGPPTVVTLQRVPVTDRRQGGMITNAAVMTMTSGTGRTKPITRGAWVASVILNDPPEPPPADVPPLAEELSGEEENLTLRERFVAHRKQAACAGCHQRIDPLGFALENYDPAGIWRDSYANGRNVDASGTLFGRYPFDSPVAFKDALLTERERFTRAFAAHLLSFALGREIGADDELALAKIVQETAKAEYRLQSLIHQIALSEPFRQRRHQDTVVDATTPSGLERKGEAPAEPQSDSSE